MSNDRLRGTRKVSSFHLNYNVSEEAVRSGSSFNEVLGNPKNIPFTDGNAVYFGSQDLGGKLHKMNNRYNEQHQIDSKNILLISKIKISRYKDTSNNFRYSKFNQNLNDSTNAKYKSTATEDSSNNSHSRQLRDTTERKPSDNYNGNHSKQSNNPNEKLRIAEAVKNEIFVANNHPKISGNEGKGDRFKEKFDEQEEESEEESWQGAIIVDRQEGLLIGGTPTFDGLSHFAVSDDLHAGI